MDVVQKPKCFGVVPSSVGYFLLVSSAKLPSDRNNKSLVGLFSQIYIEDLRIKLIVFFLKF